TKDQRFHFTDEEDDWGFDDFILFDELIDPSNGHMVDGACIIEVELCSFSKPESIK
ncbi:hypothetical protein MKX03_035181, partial [Papaver bracteatum]